MKKYLTLLAFMTWFVIPAHAQVTVTLDAGELTGPGGVTTGATAMQADSSSNGSGSLLLLVDLGSSTATVNTSVTAGHFVSGSETILTAGDFNHFGSGANETFNSLSYTGGTTGDTIALIWFPQITLNQYNSGTVPTTGEYFGAYTPSTPGATPDGGNAWINPGSSLGISLNFFTMDDQSGSQANTEGYANYIISAPEPSTFALLGLGLIALLGTGRMASRRLVVCRVQR